MPHRLITRTLAATGLAACLGTAGVVSQSVQIAPGTDIGPAPAALVIDDVVTAGESVRIESQVEGDVAAAGADVSIASPVSGYVMSAGRHVSIDAAVGNDVWAAGETVNVSSDVANNVMAAGRLVRVEADATIGQDASLAGNEVTMDGRVDRNLRIGADTARIGGEVGGTVRASARQVTVLPDAIIRGDLIVASPDPPVVAPEAQVMGNIRHEPTVARGGWMSWPWMWGLLFASLLVLGVVAVAFSPAWTARVAYTLRARTGRSLVAGVLWLVVTPIAIGLLLLTIVGIPLAALLVALCAAIVMLSGVFVAYGIGSWLIDRRPGPPAGTPWLRLAVGVLVVSLGLSLPVVGWMVAVVVTLMGAGALIVERRSAMPPVAG